MAADKIAAGCWVAASIALLVLAGCAAPNTVESCRITKLAEVPLKRARTRPVVEVMVDGQPARFLLDTGASTVLITDAARERLGLRYDLAYFGSSTSAGAQAPTRLTQPVTISLGSFELKPTRFAVVSSASALGTGGIDGLLGTSVLSDYDVDLDLKGRRMGLNAPRRCPLGPSPLEGHSVTFQSPPNPRQWLYVPARIDGRDLWLVADTGATLTYLNVEWTGLSQETLATDREVPLQTAGPDRLSTRLHRFGAFQVGPETRRDALLAVGKLQTGSDGLLGMDYLRNHRVWLSFAGWAVTVEVPSEGQ